MMNEEFFIAGAFCIFLFLLIYRMRLRHEEQRECVSKKAGGRFSFRSWFAISRWVILAILSVYMFILLWEDLNHFSQVQGIMFFLRCLIFVITIYILFVGVREYLGGKNKENTKE